MTQQLIDALSLRAVDFTRRGSLAVLTSAGLAAVVPSPSTVAKKPSKKAKRRARKKGKKKCQKQAGQCTSVFAELCAESGDPEECLARFVPCCPFFSGCQIDAFINCAFDLVSP